MTTNDEAKLISQIVNGDTHAFTKVVDAHKNLVFSLALRMLKNQEEAEEVSQDTFVKVYKSLKKFKGDSKFSTWIYRITYNTCLDRLKKSKKRFLEQELVEVQQHQIATLHNALDGMLLKEREEIIKSCLRYLPEEDAGLLTLFYFEDKNLKELEKIIDLSANTIKVRLHRARKKFATVLVNHIEPEILRNYG
ncbi:sigma-70 family RNA polymerase sigma factor [Allomuricauda sp. d1]|uniref:RNA polymerase sigma factor n=1 Tax=Allomuricauda sp. d1 TaxID=3136725 RepID=UPI0031D0CF1E